MSDNKSSFSDDKFQKTFALTDSNHEAEALTAFRMSKTYLKRYGLTFQKYFQKKEEANALTQKISKLDEENTKLESSVSDFEEKIRLIQTEIERKRALKQKPQNPNATYTPRGGISSGPTSSSQTQTASGPRTSPPPPQPPQASPVATKSKNNGWKWVGGGLAGIFLLAVINQNEDKDPARNTQVTPSTPVQVEQESRALRPNVESDFISQFYIVKYSTSLYDMNTGQERLRIPTGTCVDRFTLFNPRTINGNRLLVLAPKPGGGQLTGYVPISALRPAPSNMTEVGCLYGQSSGAADPQPERRPVQQSDSAAQPVQNQTAFGGIGITIEAAGAYLRIASVMDGLPAQRAGLRAGDLILLIDNQWSAQRMSTKEILEKIKGNVGDPVTLLVRRPNVPDAISVRMVRERVTVSASANADENRPMESGRVVRTPSSTDKMYESMEWFGDQTLREDFLLGGLRKFDRFSISNLEMPIFMRDHAPQGRDVRDLRRLFNYGYCGTTDYISGTSNQEIARAINVCTQNYRAHFHVTSNNDIHRTVLDFMFRNSSPQDYILLAMRDGVPEQSDITRIQNALNRSGFNVGTEDGDWGQNTTNGFVAFVRSQPNAFFDVSQGYLRLLQRNITNDNRNVIFDLSLSRARMFNPALKRQDYTLGQ